MKQNKIQIGLFGFGTVGRALYTVVGRARNANAEIRRIAVRDLAKPRGTDINPALFTNNPSDLLDDPEINLIVEVIDDAKASWRIVSEALRRGKAVVSGNKAMIARHLPELVELQRQTGSALLYDASSCGSIPVIRNLEEYYDNDLLLEVKGILNGSSNYILSRVFDHGEGYRDALRRAQELGFAESDPSNDIEGRDSLYKLIIITMHALGVYVAPEEVFTYGISTIDDNDIRFACEKGYKIKLVAQVAKVADDRFAMFVMPEFVDRSKYIYSVDDEYNGVVIRGECYDRQFMFGKGAGGLPTASSLLSDIMARRHDYRYEYKKTAFRGRPTYTTDVALRVYVRYSATDIPSLLPFLEVREEYRSATYRYIIGDILLRDLIAARDHLLAPDVFLCDFPTFFPDEGLTLGADS
ncbi:MAG: homoserine dehydrogenase [[Clostridium] fimetarium]|nr:homoserine dehydrogenase [Alistipes timonensis]MCM1405339.1 homoserine dehydrogenase [[Clostridium] fimetarium]